MQLDYRYMFFLLLSFISVKETATNNFKETFSHIKNPNAITDGKNGLYRKFFYIYFLYVSFCILLLCMVCFDARGHMSVNYMERHEFYSCARSMRLITKKNRIKMYKRSLSLSRSLHYRPLSYSCVFCLFAQRIHA